VLEKPAFKNAIKRRRCLVPADGYYEWQSSGSRKQPYFIHPRNGQPMGLAGLCETWVGPNGEEVDTVAIITAEAGPAMSHLHTRVPVVIQPSDYERWLDGNAMSAEDALALLEPPPDDFLAWHPVSTKVNRVANDDESLIAIAPIDIAEPEASPEQPAVKRARAVKQAADDKQGSLF
jgi:putative SOS response-associated peptidase YedK